MNCVRVGGLRSFVAATSVSVAYPYARDHEMNDNALSRDWQLPSAVTYIEVADRLALMAAQARTPEAQVQLQQLAKLYEKLAAAAARYRDADPGPGTPASGT